MKKFFGFAAVLVAALVGVDVSAVSVKGKTNERMDDIGAGVGIAAQVAVLLEERK